MAQTELTKRERLIWSLKRELGWTFRRLGEYFHMHPAAVCKLVQRVDLALGVASAERVEKARCEAEEREARKEQRRRQPKPERDLVTPVLQKVDIGEGCWIWRGAVAGNGYGTVLQSGKQWGAHRLIWTWCFGEIPDGLWVLHKCDNPICVNPDHLFLGTARDNTQDMIRKGRRHEQKMRRLREQATQQTEQAEE